VLHYNYIIRKVVKLPQYDGQNWVQVIMIVEFQNFVLKLTK